MNHQLVVNGQLISYSKLGQSNAEKTVIFLHGWRSNKEVWVPVLGQLSIVNPDAVGTGLRPERRSCQLFALDLPGFGESPAPKFVQPLDPFNKIQGRLESSRTGDKLGTPHYKNQGGWGVGDYAEVVSGFIKKLDLKNVVLVGHSFGGRIGIKLASQKPNIIGKLILVDSAGFAMDTGKKLAINLAAKIARPFFKPKIMQGLRKKIYQAIGSEDYVEASGLTQTYLQVIGEDLTEDVKKIACPTLIIYGGDDTITPPSYGEKMNSLIPNSKLLILKNAGPFSFLDKPEEFVKNLNEFI